METVSVHILEQTSGGPGTQKPRYLQYCGEMSLRQVEQSFSSFFAKCLPYLKVLRNFEKS